MRLGLRAAARLGLKEVIVVTDSINSIKSAALAANHEGSQDFASIDTPSIRGLGIVRWLVLELMMKFDMVIFLHQPSHSGSFDILSVLNAVANREAAAAAEGLLDQLARSRGAGYREEALRAFIGLNVNGVGDGEGDDEAEDLGDGSGDYIDMGNHPAVNREEGDDGGIGA